MSCMQTSINCWKRLLNDCERNGRLGVSGDVVATIIDRIVKVASESDLSIDSVDNILSRLLTLRQAGGNA